jgi:two-component system, OmpR family, heavy metal sensor histidine kinase CusS
MKISFRLRLFIISVLIVAVVLASVMLFGWSRVLSLEVEKLDVRLCMEARRMASQPTRPERMADVATDIASKLRLTSNTQLLLRVDENDGAARPPVLLWPSLINPDQLNWRNASPLLDTQKQEAQKQDAQNNSDNRQPPAREFDPPAEHRPRPPPRDDMRQENEAYSRSSDSPPRPSRGLCSLASFTDQGHDWRVAKFESSEFARSQRSSIIAADLATMKEELQSALNSALTIVIPMALALAALGAWLLSSLAMRPVNRLRLAMQTVTRNDLDQRLPTIGEDREFVELIDAYNTMLERLEASFHQASRFSGDAAHELRTPLTILQGRIEQALRANNDSAIQADLAGLLDEVGLMSAITRKLLLLSQADAGRLALHVEIIDLTALLDALITDARLLVEDRQLQVTIDRNLTLEGDQLLLRQLFNNLISNAMRYCLPPPDSGWIKVNTEAHANGINVIFANRSHYISIENRQRFFDRFYRGDAAHNRSIDGTGLGLSLAREIARAHGGDLTLLASPLDEVVFKLWLPRTQKTLTAHTVKS